MSVYVVKCPMVLIDGMDVASRTNSISLGIECDMLEKTNYDSCTTKEYTAGLMSFTVDYSGFFSAGDNDIDDNALAKIGTDSKSYFLIAPENSASTGDLAYFGQANSATYTALGSVGEIAPFSISLTGEGRPCNGTVIFSRTVGGGSSGYGEVFDLGGLPSGTNLQTILQVTNFSGIGNFKSVLDASCTSGFGSGVTEISYTTFTGEGAEMQTSALSSTDQPFYRIDYASSDAPNVDATFAVALNFGG